MAVKQDKPLLVDIELQKQLRAQLAAAADKTGSLPVDEAIVRALPKGTTVQSSSFHGRSHTGFVTTKLSAIDANGKPVHFFVKYVAGEIGETLLRGEFEGMRAIETVAPAIVPHVIATGLTVSLPKLLFPKHLVPIAFYATQFLNLTPVMDLPPSRLVAEALATLHATSMAHPSNPGTFGFHMNTYNGKRLQPVSPPRATWSDLWATYMMNLHHQSAAANASDEWPEFAVLMKRVCSHLIPRMFGPDFLCEPASRGGGPLRPALLHGDLWDGNVALNTDTGGLVMFDCSAMWGHHEVDLALLTCPMREFSHTPISEEYESIMEPSEPKDEWQDRRRVYGLKEFLGRSIRWPGHISRQFTFDELFDLMEKYAPWDQDDPERASVAARHSQESRDVVLAKMVAAKDQG